MFVCDECNWAPLAALPALARLDLQMPPPRFAPPPLPALTYLHLHGSRIHSRGQVNLGALGTLRELDLGRMDLSALPAGLDRLTGLQTLCLGGSSGIVGGGFGGILGMGRDPPLPAEDAAYLRERWGFEGPLPATPVVLRRRPRLG